MDVLTYRVGNPCLLLYIERPLFSVNQYEGDIESRCDVPADGDHGITKMGRENTKVALGSK